MKALTRVVAVFCIFGAACIAQTQQSRTSTSAAGEWQIAGIVVDSISNQPLSGVSVLIAPVEDRDSTRTTKTGADGRFLFSRVAKGKFSLAANRRGYPTQGFNQHGGYATAIVTGPALDTEHLIFRLSPEATIRGSVTDEENESVQNAMVRLFASGIDDGRLGTRMVRMASTDDRGAYSFAHLPEGTYYVAVSGQPWSATLSQPRFRRRFEVRQQAQSVRDELSAPTAKMDDDDAAELDKVYPLTFYGGSLSSSEATAIDLNPGQSVTADIAVSAVPNVHLHIPIQQNPASAQLSTDANPQTPQRMMVSNLRQPPRVELFQSVFEGTLIPAATVMGGSSEGFDISLAPGNYFLQTSSRGDSEPGGTYQEIDLAADMDLPPSSTPTGSVSGIAQFLGAKPPDSLVFFLANRQTSQQYGTQLKGDGEFRIEEPIMPGKYEVAVGNSPGWYLQSISATGARLSGRTLQVTGSEPVRLTVKVAHGLGQVDGVVMREGKPWAGAMVVLVPRNAGNNAVLFRRDESDSDGTFTLRDVVPGNYNLIAIEGGWKLAWSDPRILQPYLKSAEAVQVAPGGKAQITVQAQNR